MNYSIVPTVGYSETFVTIQREGFGGLKLSAVLTSAQASDGKIIMAREVESVEKVTGKINYSWPIVKRMECDGPADILKAIEDRRIVLGSEFWT